MRLLLVLAIAACGNKKPASDGKVIVEGKDAMQEPVVKVDPIAGDVLCVTKGAAAIGAKVSEPTVRAFARGSSGDAASMTFVFRGDSDNVRELASGQARRQLGLKLRAQDGCNLIYIMWRLDPKPALEVSIKVNPGKRTHKDCGANGYTKLKPAAKAPALEPGTKHTLRAEIANDELVAWIDDKLVWRGTLPAGARELVGPAGLRSDNLAFDLVAFSAPAGTAAAPPAKCIVEDSD